jgi:tRNA-specific 2-thiouridylase
VLDVSQDFNQEIIKYFENSYKNGLTPNPCIMCNKQIKWGKIFDYAVKELNCNYIATGHYAKIIKDEKTNRYCVAESITAAKDQTYVLYNMSQEELSHVLMPLGDYTKDEIREIARKNGFITADKKDSQEICFVEDNDYANFITTNYNYKNIPGEFVDTKGNKYGTHKGIIHYTVGQRRGLGLSLKFPLYVKKVDSQTHEVILCPKEELYTNSLVATAVNLMAIETLNTPTKASVKIRYAAPKVNATLIPMENGEINVVFDEPVRAVTPGQAVVFYNDNIVIGGGIIK